MSSGLWDRKYLYSYYPDAIFPHLYSQKSGQTGLIYSLSDSRLIALVKAVLADLQPSCKWFYRRVEKLIYRKRSNQFCKLIRPFLFVLFQFLGRHNRSIPVDNLCLDTGGVVLRVVVASAVIRPLSVWQPVLVTHTENARVLGLSSYRPAYFLRGSRR